MKLLKTLKLGFIDDSLKDYYVRFRPYGISESKKYLELSDTLDAAKLKAMKGNADVHLGSELHDFILKIKDLVSEMWVEGSVPDNDGNAQPMTKDDLNEMPTEFFLTAARFLDGQQV